VGERDESIFITLKVTQANLSLENNIIPGAKIYTGSY
jgi:hypothetical protein